MMAEMIEIMEMMRLTPVGGMMMQGTTGVRFNPVRPDLCSGRVGTRKV